MTDAAIDLIGPDAGAVIDLPSQAAIIRAVFEGQDVTPMIQAQLDRLHADVTDAGAYITLSLLYQLAGQKESAMGCQEAGLHYARLYRQPVQGAKLRLLTIVARGDLMTNTPVELMLEGQGVEVIRLYADQLGGLVDSVPDHDVALMAIGESDETRPMLDRLKGLAARWARPVLNEAGTVLDLSRDRLWRKLADIPGLAIPPTVRISRAALMTVARGERGLGEVLPGGEYPLIVRPVGSHAGKGLQRIEDGPALAAYLDEAQPDMAYVSRFIDYASADGGYRKYRIAFFGGRPFLAHMAIGDHWMVHYLNAGMAESQAKRDEEARTMAGFDTGFAARHAAVFDAMSERLGLDYYAVDCAETPDGELLLFEADVSMIVHALDPVDLYPYKPPQMAKLFATFAAMLAAKAKA
jgi:glutathione synthase/RimK-type ligase-like ATP-grasp enzyme